MVTPAQVHPTLKEQALVNGRICTDLSLTPDVTVHGTSRSVRGASPSFALEALWAVTQDRPASRRRHAERRNSQVNTQNWPRTTQHKL